MEWQGSRPKLAVSLYSDAAPQIPTGQCHQVAMKPPPQKPAAAPAPCAAASTQSSTEGQKHVKEVIEIDSSSDDEENEITLETAGFMQNIDSVVEKGNPVDQEKVNVILDSLFAKGISSPSKQKMAFQALTTNSLTSQGGATQDGNRDASVAFASRQMNPTDAEDSTATETFQPNTSEPDFKPAADDRATLTKPTVNNTNRHGAAAEESAIASRDLSEKEGHTDNKATAEDPSDATDARQNDSNEQEPVAATVTLHDDSSKADAVATAPSAFSRARDGLASIVWMAFLTVVFLLLFCFGLAIIAVMFAGLVGMWRTLHEEDDE